MVRLVFGFNKGFCLGCGVEKAIDLVVFKVSGSLPLAIEPGH